MLRNKRVWWLVLGVAGLLVAGSAVGVLLLRHDHLEEKLAKIGEDMTLADVVRIMGRPADSQRFVQSDPTDEAASAIPVLFWTDGQYTAQITFNSRWVVMEVRVWQNETLLERLKNWLGW